MEVVWTSRDTKGTDVLEVIWAVGGKERPERGAAVGSWVKIRSRRSEPHEARWVPVVGWNHFAWGV